MKSLAVISSLIYLTFFEMVATDENCKDLKTCSFNRDRNAPLCFCDDDCVYYKDCCDDYSKTLMIAGLPKKVKGRRHRITTSICDLIPEDSKIGVKVISACNSDHTLNCTKADNNSEIIDMVYATGSDGLTYKNRHCALCNGLTSFQIWSLQFHFSRSVVSSLGHVSCEGSVFDNIIKMSKFEMASYLVKTCSYRFIPPSRTKPRLCVREIHACNAFILDDENPFTVLKSSDALGMTALFKFDYRSNDRSNKVHGESTQHSTDLILSNRVVTHRLWLKGDSHLKLDQLLKLVESMYTFLNTALPDMIPVDPFIIDYIVVDANEFRIQIFIVFESIDFVKLSRYRIVKEWLNNLIIRYQNTDVYKSRSYKLESALPSGHFSSANKSYNVVKMRYYSDYYIIDFGAKLFGKKFNVFEAEYTNMIKITFSASMCKKISISSTSYFNETRLEIACVSDETTKQSQSSNMYPSVMGLCLISIFHEMAL